MFIVDDIGLRRRRVTRELGVGPKNSCWVQTEPYLFAGSIVIAYSFLVEAEWLKFLFLLLLLVTGATMAVSFLSFAATNQFQIAYYGIGPTEIRIGYIALNTFVWLVGTAIFSWGVPLVLALNVIAFTVLARQTSQNLWQIDYEANVDNAPR